MSPGWDVVTLEYTRVWVRLFKFSTQVHQVLIMLSLGFLIYKMGTMIGPTSLGIAKIHNRDDSYKTLTHLCCVKSSNGYQHLLPPDCLVALTVESVFGC